MGLNDPYFTLGDDDSEATVQKVTIDVFKDTPAGDAPELKDNVDFIAIPQEPFSDEENSMNARAALEDACVKLRDLELLTNHIYDSGGMSQQIAIEALHIVPGLITDRHPKEYYTQSPTRTSLNYALEEVENEKQGIFKRIGNVIKTTLDRFIAWFRKFINRITGKEAEELNKRNEKVKAERDEAWKTAQDMVEQMDALRRAAQASDEEFKETLKNVRAAHSAEINKLNEAHANEKTRLGEARAKIINLESQMRMLDDTKNREIAAALDKIDSLKRSAETSREKRISLGENVEKLETIVLKAMIREALQLVKDQNNDIAKEYTAWSQDHVLKYHLLCKYLFGNGFQNRVQSLKQVVNAVLAGSALIPHMKKLTSAFEQAINNPKGLTDVIGEIDFAHFATGEQIFKKTKDFQSDASGISPKQFKLALDQMADEIVKAKASLGEVKFDDLILTMEKLSKDVGEDARIPANASNLNEIANAYKATHSHVMKIMSVLHKGAVAVAEINNVADTIEFAYPTPNGHNGYIKSQEAENRIKAITDKVAQNVSVMESFSSHTLNEYVRNALIAAAHVEGNK